MTALANRQSPGEETAMVRITRDTAATAASDTCSRFANGGVQVLETHLTTAFSIGTQRAIHVWETLCRTEDATFMVRMNADSGAIFGVNNITVGDPGEEYRKPLLTREQGLLCARKYLRVLYGRKAAMRPMARIETLKQPLSGRMTYHFEERLSGGAHRTINIAVRMEDGSLNDFCYVPQP